MVNSTIISSADTRGMPYVAGENSVATWSVFVDSWSMPDAYRADLSSAPEPSDARLDGIRSYYGALLAQLPTRERRGDMSLLSVELEGSRASIAEAENLVR